MTPVAAALADYLALRRAMGYKLVEDGRQLACFVRHLDDNGIDTVTVAAAVAWATSTARAGNGARRLAMVRCFARYLQATDPAHEVPPTRLLPGCETRPVPHLFTDPEIAALLRAARELDPPAWAATVHTMVGLLAVTGMRVGETLRLDRADVDLDTAMVTVRLSKFNKSRHVPISASTVAALARYAAQRPPATPGGSLAWFVTAHARRVPYPKFAAAFTELVATAGIGEPCRPRPRIGDLRHSFAVRTLLGWYRDGADVDAWLPRLSTYLGHVDPRSTYWYLHAAPELMALAAERLDRHDEGARR